MRSTWARNVERVGPACVVWGTTIADNRRRRGFGLDSAAQVVAASVQSMVLNHFDCTNTKVCRRVNTVVHLILLQSDGEAMAGQRWCRTKMHADHTAKRKEGWKIRVPRDGARRLCFACQVDLWHIRGLFVPTAQKSSLSVDWCESTAVRHLDGG